MGFLKEIGVFFNGRPASFIKKKGVENWKEKKKSRKTWSWKNELFCTSCFFFSAVEVERQLNKLWWESSLHSRFYRNVYTVILINIHISFGKFDCHFFSITYTFLNYLIININMLGWKKAELNMEAKSFSYSCHFLNIWYSFLYYLITLIKSLKILAG